MAFPKLTALMIFLLACSQTLNKVVADFTFPPQNFLKEAKDSEVFDWMVDIRNRLHKMPELLYEEFETSALIKKKLIEIGIEDHENVAKTGVIAYIGTGDEPFVALRADMDGLPIQEMVDWEHKSQIPDRMHACGHDAHVSMLLGAAKMLKKHEKQLPGTIILVFQPAEEGGAGALKVLAETEKLKKAKAIFGLHVAPLVNVGYVGGKAGEMMAGSGIFEAKIVGRGGHAALPNLGPDPVVAAASVILSLQHLISREAAPGDPQVISVTQLNGSQAFNVIPDHATIGGTFRAFKSIGNLKTRIREVIESQAKVSNCEATVNFFEEDAPMYPPVINDHDLHDHFWKVATDMVGEEKVAAAPLLTVSEDFAFYQSHGLKGYFFGIGVQNKTEGRIPPHNDLFTIAEEAFSYGAALHASLATSYLIDDNSNRLRDEL